ncbi:MAG: zinc-type alcohol dehydrogenase YcjQ [Conexibacter sp.]|nr:zinc-type alcohol dehydrogenase YcjQ [Conexibacter sp.]
MIARAVGIAAPGEAALLDVELAPVTDGRFCVRTRYSGVSAGTELTFLKGTNPFLHADWDAELGVFRHDRAGAGYPVRRLGYMEVGEVQESRAAGVREGSIVAMAYGHRDAYVADARRERWTVLPDTLDPLLGVFVAHMGPICANGLLHASAEVTRGDAGGLGDGVRGRRVLVFGGGTVGLLLARMALHHGAAEVAVVDRTAGRLAAARALGCWAIDETDGPPWEPVKDRWRQGAGSRGADVAFQCRGQVAALAEALRCLRPQGSVIDLAFYPAGAPELRLGEEFHHNGLAIRCAQIGRVPVGLDRTWDRARLARETIALLEACGDEIRRHVVTDVVPFDQGPALLRDIAHRRRHVIQAVLAC